MFNKKTIKDINVKDKIVLVRVDYNVPLKDGAITNDLRIRASLPTLSYLLEQGAKKIILISHLGRPEGEKHPELSLKPVAKALSELLQESFPENPPVVEFISDVSGPDVEAAVHNLPQRGILLLENLRFYPGEEKNSADFIKEILESTHAQIFVQDGFAVVHRAHASTEAITHELTSVAGLLVEKEVTTLEQPLLKPRHPVLVIIGGAKVDDKTPLINAFSTIADQIVVVGKIAADGFVPPKGLEHKVYIAEDFHTDADGNKFDIGELSVAKILPLIAAAKTIVWNGVAGLVENPDFSYGSAEITKAIGQNTSATTIICGGDTAGFVENYLENHPELQFSLISTGGGASLELLSGLELPGIDSLEDK